MKSADVSDAEMLDAVRRDIAERQSGLGACTWTLAERENWPEKLVGAKLDKMRRRGLVTGCACGCRGDWEIVE